MVQADDRTRKALAIIRKSEYPKLEALRQRRELALSMCGREPLLEEIKEVLGDFLLYAHCLDRERIQRLILELDGILKLARGMMS